ncbi:MAG TPA: AbrB/MazE/SpoVT family DNA-binding domain-containing protein [Stellaceae bacterium]|jgi:antitoxin MazE|nr:AbrB/MazE/SpoVT family DNA-binding domain-containing protein [Stellaceae bacterium]
MRTALRKLGNSSGVILPKSLLDEAGITTGSIVDVAFVEGRIILVPVTRNVRSGWAAASKEIAEAADDTFAWSEFGNSGDETLEW